MSANGTDMERCALFPVYWRALGDPFHFYFQGILLGCLPHQAHFRNNNALNISHFIG